MPKALGERLPSSTPVRLKQDENYIARHIDILRRAELFEKAISMCAETPLVGSPIGKIIKFQKEKCLASDVQNYTVADVMWES